MICGGCPAGSAAAQLAAQRTAGKKERDGKSAAQKLIRADIDSQFLFADCERERAEAPAVQLSVPTATNCTPSCPAQLAIGVLPTERHSGDQNLTDPPLTY